VQVLKQYFHCRFGQKSTVFSGTVTTRQRPLLDGRIIECRPVDIEDFPHQVKL